MGKNKNYYQVHKNKKPKKKFKKFHWESLHKCIIAATELVNSITELQKAMIQLKTINRRNSQEIANFGYFVNNEIIESKNGIVRYPGKYAQFTKELIEKMNKTYLNVNAFSVTESEIKESISISDVKKAIEDNLKNNEYSNNYKLKLTPPLTKEQKDFIHNEINDRFDPEYDDYHSIVHFVCDEYGIDSKDLYY